MKPAEILLEMLEQANEPHRAGLPEAARLAAGEGLASRAAALGRSEHARTTAGLAQIVRDTTTPLHRVRAAAALLAMGVDEIPEGAIGGPGGAS